MLIMISQPMNGKTTDVIKTEREKVVTRLTEMGHDVMDTVFDDFDDTMKRYLKNVPLSYLAKSLAFMAHCDGVYFMNGWETARGCKIEHEAAAAYGLKCFYETEV